MERGVGGVTAPITPPTPAYAPVPDEINGFAVDRRGV